MAYGQKVHVDWRMTNLRVDHKGRFVKGGPLYKEVCIFCKNLVRKEINRVMMRDNPVLVGD